ncbi:ZIP Zinc transporter-like protein 1 [Elsinoe fawcettii]|nr:ZIP Zinc transporter-like protein 1 [Elsinoe fawcettii]
MFRLRRTICLVLIALIAHVVASKTGGIVSEKPLSSLSVPEIEEQLQSCSLVQQLNREKSAASDITTSSLTSRIFALLFPSTPPINALLATLYISGPPNFLLALCPPNIDPNSLQVMVAFAVGGLLGDTLFHLLPEIFLGEDSPDHVRFVMVEPNKNLLLGVAIMVGFVTFMALEKTLRIATGGQGHSHDHSHAPSTQDIKSNGTSTSTDSSSSSLRQRKPQTSSPAASDPRSKVEITSSSQLSGLLNLLADFTHNITDGLALSSSFYASPTIGATTTVAVFFHEIPHEVGDFALLIQSGFSKWQAMGAQFITALGAFLGTVIGIVVQEYGSGDKGTGKGLVGTSLSWGDMLLPFTAGTFLYVGTVSVVPELLEVTGSARSEVGKTVKQFAAMAAGAGIMVAISWQ